MREADQQNTEMRIDIQVLRGISVLGVILYHSRLGVSGGFTGVDVFFVISGFVIAKSLQGSVESKQAFPLKTFIIARFKRLWPSLAFMILVVSLSSIVLLSFDTQLNTAKVALGANFGLANFVLDSLPQDYFSPSLNELPVLHSWSLSIEEQVYFLLAIVWLYLFRWRPLSSTGARVSLLITASTVSFGWLIAMVRNVEESGANVFFRPQFRVWEVFVGAIVFLYSIRKSVIARREPTLAACGFLCVMASLVVPWSGANWPGAWTLIPVVGTSLVLLSSDGITVFLGKRVARFFVWFGDRSYSLYLWHWPVLVFGFNLWGESLLVKLVLVAASVFLGSFSFDRVERRFRTKAPLTARQKVSLFALLGSSFFGVALLGIGSRYELWSGGTSGEASGRLAYGCVDQPSVAFSCSFNQGGEKGEVLLIGDSQAYTYAEGMAAAARPLGIEVSVVSRSGCPFLQPTTSVKIAGCGEWQEKAIEMVASSNFDLVLVANRSAAYVEPGWLGYVQGRTGATSVTESLLLYESSLEQGLRQILPGRRVLIVGPLPEPEGFMVGESILTRVIPSVRPSNFKPKPSLAVDQIAALETRASENFEGVLRLDPASQLCERDSCRLRNDGGALYENPSHLSAAGSLEFSDIFSKILIENVDKKVG